MRRSVFRVSVYLLLYLFVHLRINLRVYIFFIILLFTYLVISYLFHMQVRGYIYCLFISSWNDIFLFVHFLLLFKYYYNFVKLHFCVRRTCVCTGASA